MVVLGQVEAHPVKICGHAVPWVKDGQWNRSMAAPAWISTVAMVTIAAAGDGRVTNRR